MGYLSYNHRDKARRVSVGQTAKQEVDTQMTDDTETIEPTVSDDFAAQKPDMSEWHSGPVLEISFPELLEETRGMSLTEEQAKTLIESYWNIAMHFVKMGFGLHPVQLIENDQKPKENSRLCEDFLASDDRNMVQLQYDREDKKDDKTKPDGGAP